MRAAWLVVTLVPFVAGCAAPDGLALGGGGSAAAEPFYEEHREVVSGSHLKLFEIPVSEPARLVNATVVLDARTNGLPLPLAAPARLDLRLLDPNGAPLRSVQVDGQHPSASLLLEDVSLPGVYFLEVRGVGASEEVDGARYGAGYVATIEIVY